MARVDFGYCGAVLYLRFGIVSVEYQIGVVPSLRDWKVFSNYRGITLPSLPGKAYSREIEGRLWPIIEPRIQEKCGFHHGRGMVGHVLPSL